MSRIQNPHKTGSWVFIIVLITMCYWLYEEQVSVVEYLMGQKHKPQFCFTIFHVAVCKEVSVTLCHVIAAGTPPSLD